MQLRKRTRGAQAQGLAASAPNVDNERCKRPAVAGNGPEQNANAQVSRAAAAPHPQGPAAAEHGQQAPEQVQQQTSKPPQPQVPPSHVPPRRSASITSADGGLEEGELNRLLDATHVIEPCYLLWNIDDPSHMFKDYGYFIKSKLKHLRTIDPKCHQPFTLGEGAFGIVHLALYVHTDWSRTPVAVKTPHSRSLTKHVVKEINNWKQLSMHQDYHLHLPMFYGLYSGDSVVLEALWDDCWHRDQTIRQPAMCTRISNALQLTKALKWLHSVGYIHTDLKLDNVGVRAPSSRGICITDVGDCKVMVNGKITLLVSKPNMPPHFWHAPERKAVSIQKGGHPYAVCGHEIDLYSLGSCFMSILWGHDGNKLSLKSHPACEYRIMNPKLDLSKLKEYALLKGSNSAFCQKMAMDLEKLCYNLLLPTPHMRPSCDEVVAVLKKYRMWNGAQKRLVNECLSKK